MIVLPTSSRISELVNLRSELKGLMDVRQAEHKSTDVFYVIIRCASPRRAFWAAPDFASLPPNPKSDSCPHQVLLLLDFMNYNLSVVPCYVDRIHLGKESILHSRHS